MILSSQASATSIKRQSYPRVRIHGIRLKEDRELTWLKRAYPGRDVEEWRALAAEWMQREVRNVSLKLAALSLFFTRYVMVYNLTDPAVLLLRNNPEPLPDFFHTACPDSAWGKKANRIVYDFIEFVLERRFSVKDEGRHPVTLADYRNPIVLPSKYRKLTKRGSDRF